MAKIRFYKTDDFPESGPDGLYFLREGEEFSLMVRSAAELFTMREDDPTVPQHVKDITATEINQWSAAYGNTHSHANKSVLDNITAVQVSNWDNAYAMRHSHSNKAILDATEEAFTTALKTKLDGIAAGANNYSHPTGDGNLHVPATGTGSLGKFLRAGATAASIAWALLTAGDIPSLEISKITGLQTALDSKIGLSSQLAGFTVGSNTAIVASDTILSAFGKTQAQINALSSASGNYILLSKTTVLPDADLSAQRENYALSYSNLASNPGGSWANVVTINSGSNRGFQFGTPHLSGQMYVRGYNGDGTTIGIWNKVAYSNGTNSQYIGGDGIIRDNAAVFILNQNAIYQSANFTISGNGSIQGILYVGRALSTISAVAKLGHERTANGYAYIDFIGDTTYSEYGLRIIRENTGANANSNILHRGTGTLSISAVESAIIRFTIGGAERGRFFTDGSFILGSTTNTGLARLQVTGAIQQTAVSSGLLKSVSGVISQATAGTDYIAPASLSSYLPLAGGTMTGIINFHSSQTNWINFNGLPRLRGAGGGSGTVLAAENNTVYLRPNDHNTATNQVTVDSSGNLISYTPNAHFGYNVQNNFLGIGRGKSSDGYVVIDIVASSTNNGAYDYRISRNAGVNGTAVHSHRGIGQFSINLENSAPFAIMFNGTEQYKVFTSGRHRFGGGADQGTYKVQVDSGSSNGNGLWVNGIIYSTNNVKGYSDRNLKTNIRQLKDPIYSIQQLIGCSFEIFGRKDYGLIAQDVQRVLPHAVSMLDGKLVMSYEPIHALTVEAIKELIHRDDDKEQRINELERKVVELEGRLAGYG